MIDLAAEFERVWPYLEPAVQREGGDYDKQAIWADIERGSSQLWPLTRSAIVTNITQYPTGKRVICGWLAGGELSEIARIVPLIEDYAREAGCSEARILGRTGWSRALGYRSRSVVLTKDL